MLKTDPKILLTTVYRRRPDDYYDYWGENALTRFRPSALRKLSGGLRFLKQNIPQLEILEYPLWPEYLSRLKEGWDVVGYSFYLNEIPEILEMADAARRAGIKELWAGNYGALTPGIDCYFDRIFLGPSEHKIASLLGYNLERVRHPPLVGVLRLGPFWTHYRKAAALFTSRSCPYKCTFCQTPAFSPTPERIPIESIEEVLQYISSIGCRHVVILDENFGMFLDHADRVFELLGRYRMYAAVMIRADRLLKRLDSWVKNGLEAAFIGVENLAQPILDGVEKRLEVEVVKEAVERLHRYHCYVLGYYMIGFPEETEDSIRDGIESLAGYGIDFHQVCVVTPLPRTQLWDEIEKRYGIFEKDWHRYDLKHLVWNHPHIRPERMRELLNWAFRRLNRPSTYFKSIGHLMRRYEDQEGTGRAILHLLSSPLKVQFFNYRDPCQRWFL